MTKKLVLEAEDTENNAKMVFIDSDLHKQLVDLKNQTGIPIRKLANKLLANGLDNLEVVPSKDGSRPE